jgi:hypothetical protein
MDRPAALTALLLGGGLALAASPLVAPAEPPPDRVEYYVEADAGPATWTERSYANLSAAGQRVFDAARTNASGYHNVTTDAFDGPPPLADGTIAPYSVRADGEWFLLQVTYLETTVPADAHFLRLGALLGGLLTALAGGYRAVTA